MGKKKNTPKLFGVRLDPCRTTVPDHIELWLYTLEQKGIFSSLSMYIKYFI